MNIVVLLRMVPDVVEELEVASDGKSLDSQFLRMIASESDNHALEEALILKERHGGTVTVLAVDGPEAGEVLYTALAQGADRAIKLSTAHTGLSTAATVRAFAEALATQAGLLPTDLILTGTQAIDDLDGLIAPWLAHLLGLPFAGIVTAVTLDLAAGNATVLKEFPNSVLGEFEVPLPAVLGIQAAERPPRYVPVAKVRAVMKSRQIEQVPCNGDFGGGDLFAVVRMAKREPATRAEMLEGDPDTVAGALCEILGRRGLI